jgi:hypothetical protein
MHPVNVQLLLSSSNCERRSVVKMCFLGLFVTEGQCVRACLYVCEWGGYVRLCQMTGEYWIREDLEGSGQGQT